MVTERKTVMRRHEILVYCDVERPMEVSLSGLEFKGKMSFLEEPDFQLPILKTAIEYLVLIGKSEIVWLERNNGGYSSLPTSADRSNQNS